MQTYTPKERVHTMCPPTALEGKSVSSWTTTFDRSAKPTTTEGRDLIIIKYGNWSCLYLLVRTESDRHVKNDKQKLKEKLKPCILSYLHTADQSLPEGTVGLSVLKKLQNWSVAAPPILTSERCVLGRGFSALYRNVAKKLIFNPTPQAGEQKYTHHAHYIQQTL